jgi:nucleotide-binding universal stress UspA family protein
MGRIVVGFDGSEGSARALRWAVGEAEVRSAELLAVMAWQALEQHHADGTDDVDATYGSAEAHQAGLSLVEQAGIDPNGLTVVSRYGPPVTVLVDAAADAELLVLGSRGHGGFTGLLLGSISDQCLQRSPCPVVVVPSHLEEGAAPTDRLVVGTDGSAGADAALQWALVEAKRRSAGVDLVHGWELPYLEVQAMATSVLDVDAGRQCAQQVLEEVLGRLDPEDRDLVRLVSDQASPGEALLRAAQGADLVVVGGPPPTGITRFLVGSVARQVVAHATRPVAVVRAHDTAG